MKAAAAAAAGRQAQRSGHRHQRQYSSEQFIFDQNLPSSGIHVSQQVDYSRMLRSAQRGLAGEFPLSSEPLTPTVSSRPSSQMMNRGDFSPEVSPGILDLHSYDTELLSDIRVSGLYDSPSSFGQAIDPEFDDFEPNYYGNDQVRKAGLIPEDDLQKSFDVDKEKLSSVAKIKVVVRKRPLNRKERAKREEDIITIEHSTSSLTVHETKLKLISNIQNIMGVRNGLLRHPVIRGILWVPCGIGHD
ncbi:hypothetical protein KSP40_PGU018012 [Platanthera guangdongensis]|uniref:Kinesin motor domain-containing protein n=1 Tax=Platanthera guangdongensis TaxID=2320717 RepID=A0ABR2N0A6_9ASPA